jgi:hypothetical protein
MGEPEPEPTRSFQVLVEAGTLPFTYAWEQRLDGDWESVGGNADTVEVDDVPELEAVRCTVSNNFGQAVETLELDEPEPEPA